MVLRSLSTQSRAVLDSGRCSWTLRSSLVILIVALVVLGPDKLPTVARQMGAAWGEIRKFRERLETEVRGTFPDLPSTQQVAQAVRSPLSFLDQLADAHEREQQNAENPSRRSASRDQPLSNPTLHPGHEYESGIAGCREQSPAADGTGALEQPGDASRGDTRGDRHDVGSVSALTGESSGRRPSDRRTRPWRGADPGEPVASSQTTRA